jgi:hypothetical protein
MIKEPIHLVGTIQRIGKTFMNVILICQNLITHIDTWNFHPSRLINLKF